MRPVGTGGRRIDGYTTDVERPAKRFEDADGKKPIAGQVEPDSEVPPKPEFGDRRS